MGGWRAGSWSWGTAINQVLQTQRSMVLCKLVQGRSMRLWACSNSQPAHGAPAQLKLHHKPGWLTTLLNRDHPLQIKPRRLCHAHLSPAGADDNPHSEEQGVQGPKHLLQAAPQHGLQLMTAAVGWQHWCAAMAATTRMPLHSMQCRLVHAPVAAAQGIPSAMLQPRSQAFI